MAFTLEDNKGREVLVVNDNWQFAFSRFSDMDDMTKEELVEMYESLSGKTGKDFQDFLNFKSNVEQFCS